VTVALYPGSFDPITNGHLNLIERGLRVFDRVIIAVAINRAKQPLFSPEDRMALIREAVERDDEVDQARVEIASFTGLLVDFAKQQNAPVVLRGLRAISDFEFEFQMTHMNRRLHPGLEMVFMMTDEEYFFVSSSLVREIAAFGGKVQGLVPPNVERALAERYR
jgi:pantetheine-phosphate adenylyltransferase